VNRGGKEVNEREGNGFERGEKTKKDFVKTLSHETKKKKLLFGKGPLLGLISNEMVNEQARKFC
jgi:hypothetical protein